MMPYHRIVRPLKLDEKRIAQIRQLRHRLYNHPQQNYTLKDEERQITLALISYWMKQFKKGNLTRK